MKELAMQKKIYIVGILILTVVGVNFLYLSWANQEVPVQQELIAGATPIRDEKSAYVFPLSEASYIPFLDATIPRPNLTAKAAIVYDMQTSRYLYEQDVQKQLPIASLTKIMSAVIVLEKMNPDEIATIPKQAVRVDELEQDLFIGERIRVDNLMTMMLIESSNDAAYALAAHAQAKGFDMISAMNLKARDLGMRNTRFLDAAGLNDNGHSTAEDLAKLVYYALRYKEIWTLLQEKEMTVTSEDGKITHTVLNTNQLLGTIPNISGGKTGYTDTALGCMILIVDIPGHKDKIISVILGSQDRFGDTRSLVEWITEAYRWE